MKMKQLNALLLFFICSISLANGQDKIALQYAANIDTVAMRSVITTLASEAFEGRKTNSEVIKLSENYLIEQLRTEDIQFGNVNTYCQNIEAYHHELTRSFEVSNFNLKEHYSYKNTPFQDSVISSSDIVFAGYGIYDVTYNDFQNVDITDKIVLILDGKGPLSKYGVKYHNASSIPSKSYFESQKPKAVLSIVPGFETIRSYSNSNLQFTAGKKTPAYADVKINELTANHILKPINKTVKQLQYEIESNLASVNQEFTNPITFRGNNAYKQANLNNVVAIIEGRDLKDEFIVLSAHYDHIGKSYNGKTCNGADDNASGVSAVLEVAKQLNQAKKRGKGPRRSVIILLTTAEEDGLCGAEYYVKHPIYPLENTVACVNADMLGRNGSAVDEADVQKGYVYAYTGSRSANDSLSNMIAKVNLNTTQLSIPSTVDYLFNRSDHYKFYEAGIPSVFFTNGPHEDLHKTGDDVEKIDFEALLNRTKLLFFTVWEMANQTNPYSKKN